MTVGVVTATEHGAKKGIEQGSHEARAEVKVRKDPCMAFPPVLWKASLRELSRALIWCVFGLWHFPAYRVAQCRSLPSPQRSAS